MAVKKKGKSKMSKDPEKAARQRATQFKKGHTKSKGFGRPKMTDEEKALSLKTRTQFKNILNRYITLPKAELNKLYRAANTPALDKMVIKSILKSMEGGDQVQINWFVNHILGKEREQTNINLTGSMENTNSIDLKKLSKEELLSLKAMAEKTQSDK